ncbi:MAG: alpha/beta hydrolase, partial [Mesorhizobium sp.]
LAILGWERMRLGSDVPSRLLPKLTFQAWGKAVPNHRTLFDWLSRDPVEVDKYIADPLCGWDASVSMWRDVVNLALYAGRDSSFAGVPRHESLNEVNRDIIMNDFAAWADHTLNSSGIGPLHGS